jgi:hypothetical protein
MIYRKRFALDIEVDKTYLGTSFLNAHSDNWQDEIPTDLELYMALRNEIYSWLNDCRIRVLSLDAISDEKYLRRGLDVALELLSDRGVNSWSNEMEKWEEE